MHILHCSSKNWLLTNRLGGGAKLAHKYRQAIALGGQTSIGIFPFPTILQYKYDT